MFPLQEGADAVVENKERGNKAGTLINVEEVGAKEITSFHRHVSLYKLLIFHNTTVIRDLCL